MMSSFSKIYSLVKSKNKSIFYYLFFLMFINMLLEIFGITLLIPLLNFISDETMCNQTCENIFSYFEINIDQFTFLKLILLSLLFVFFIKTFFVTYLIYKQNQTILNLLSSFAKKLFKYYINQTYLYHVEKNPAILIRNINQEVSAVVSNYLNSLLSLLMEILVCIGIVIILFIYQPYGLLLASVVFGILSILFSIFTKKKVKAWGKVRQENEQKKIKNLIQAFNSIKEIKLYSKEEYFEKINRITFDTHASINTKNSVLNAVIRPWLEFFFIFTIVILVSFLILNGNSINTIFATLALFGAAAFKLLPSVNKILINTQSMRFTQNAVDLIYNEFSNIIDISQNNLKDSFKIDFNNISFNDISVKYPSRDNLSIKNINFSINKNQIIGIVGLSGAGKSTLIDTLIGLVPPRSGEIQVNNKDQNLSKNEWKNCIGYVPQNIYLVDDSIINNIAFGVQKKDISVEKINETIKVVQLEKFITELKQGYETNVGDKGVKLSGGQKQRIGIARALYNNPSLLILDEATSSLDIFTEKEIMDFIFSLKGQITVVIVSHRLTTVEKCDYIYELENGSISYEGKAKNVIDKINKKYNS